VGAKKPFVLRLKEETLEAVQKWADDEFRSINGQMEWILDQALKKTGRQKKSNKEDEKSK